MGPSNQRDRSQREHLIDPFSLQSLNLSVLQVEDIVQKLLDKGLIQPALIIA